MAALKQNSQHGQSSRHNSLQTYNLRLLKAEREPNTTSVGIAEALLRFPALIYLDLSYTTPARDRTVLSTLPLLEDLQVLKLRGIGLKDSDAEFLANAVGIRVRFLDIRNNLLTDMAVRSLMQACLGPATATRTDIGLQGQQPASSSAFGPYDADILKRADLDELVLSQLTRPLTGSSLVESLPHVGMTHLFISDNQITLEGVASLIASKKLHVLDVGTVDTAESIRKGQRIIGATDPTSFPGAEKLVPVLGKYGQDTLTYLRVHHAVVTADTPVKDAGPLSALLPELPSETADPEPAAELPATNEIFELPADTEFRVELEDTSVGPSAQPYSQPKQDSVRNTYKDEPIDQVRRGSVFAPEVVNDDVVDDENTLLSATGTGFRESSTGSLDPRSQKIQELLSKRPKNNGIPRRDSAAYTFPYFHPSHVPHIDTLALTDIPSTVPANSPILSSLIRFITACSDEALLATLQSKSDYSLPPGRARLTAEKEQARRLFALRRLVLEIAPKNRPKQNSWKQLDTRLNSTTGDPDSEQLWSAAMDDFSFFEAECGIPDNDQGKYFPMAILNQKVSLTPEDDDSIRSARSDIGSPLSGTMMSGTSHPGDRDERRSKEIERQQYPQEPQIDLVAALAAFRRSKKAEYEDLMRTHRIQRHSSSGDTSSLLSPPFSSFSLSGCPSPSPPLTPTTPTWAARPVPPSVEGHWKGEVKIVRNAEPRGRSGVVDMYGNYFEKGYLYP
ncbi:conserved hypothetical protein [Paecilomyces variotii No. 5]|uniref:Leucine Rich Repeat domain protein n=1 Tax=Byssochlamys spectabilis (strain No. 5 / NBRC 109023) TaxID=1356009 RepID=V5FAD8_BYSSN|nr:conserved hypothetical protein [Paecilomyces variotii No. 5]